MAAHDLLEPSVLFVDGKSLIFDQLVCSFLKFLLVEVTDNFAKASNNLANALTLELKVRLHFIFVQSW